MRLTTLSTESGSRVVAVRDSGTPSETFLDLAAADPELSGSLIDLLSLPDGLDRAADAAATCERDDHTVEGTRLAPIPVPGKVICIGLNYRDHAIETGADIPGEPVCFGKFSSAVTGPDMPIVIPPAVTQPDFEAELVVVIGRIGRELDRESAREIIAGYTIGHDVSARDWQKGRPGGQWLLGKTPDTFAPLGPDLVTADEVPDPHALDIRLAIDDEIMQDSNTRELIFPVEDILVHLSRVMTLRPGDVIYTGTPSGVGMGRTPKRWLHDGETVSVTISGLGTLRNRVVRES